jgi:tetratricopeptide (TPR) repeat protein
LQAKLDEPEGSRQLRAYFIRRGDLVYQLVFIFPAQFPRYSMVVDRMVAGLRFEEPRALREARARALLFPSVPWPLSKLGEELRHLGELKAALEALAAAVREQPDSAQIHRQLSRALLQVGELGEACAHSAAAVRYAPKDPQALEADARCELERGNSERALARLRQARALAPSDERLKRAEAALRSALNDPPR